jgi:hypothetical protein
MVSGDLPALVQELAARHGLDLCQPRAGLFIEAPPYEDLVIGVWDSLHRFSVGRLVFNGGHPLPGLRVYYSADWRPLAAYDDHNCPADIAHAERTLAHAIRSRYLGSGRAVRAGEAYAAEAAWHL